MSAVKDALRRVGKTAAAGLDLVVRPPSGIVVMLYHRVGAASGGEVDLSVAAFEYQAAYLADHSTVIDLDQALDILAGKRLAPPRPVVLTFDDGTADFVDNALPVLARHELPVTLYLNTGPVEEGRGFWNDGAVLSWGGVQEALATGLVTVGSHTHEHRPFDEVTPDEAEADLDRSTGLIEDHLGITPRHFAYPKAIEPAVAVEEVVRRRFDSAALEGSRPNVVRRTDPFRLARSPIQVSDGESFFRRKVAGGLRLESTVRGVLRERGRR